MQGWTTAETIGKRAFYAPNMITDLEQLKYWLLKFDSTGIIKV